MSQSFIFFFGRKSIIHLPTTFSPSLLPTYTPMSFEPFTFVFERLTDLLTSEIKVFCADTEEEIKRLQQVVEVAQTLLRDVDEVQRQANINNELQIKVREVMSILDEVEDFLDSIYQGEEAQQIDQGWVRGVVSRVSHISNSLKRKRSNVKWAKDIREKLQDAVHCLKGHQLSSDSPQFTRRRRLQTQPDIIKEEFIVRLEEDVKTYLAQLVSKEAKLSKDLAIFGMGGAGKTTTARVLYNDKQISKHFDKSAWVCASQVWDKNQLLLQICQQVGVPVLDGKENLDHKLRTFLRDSSCFFVLDDVWEVKALIELLPVLRSTNSRGRLSSVLVTTRNKDIFDFPQHDFSIHKIRPLTLEESRNLFVKTLDRNNSEDSKWYLEGEFVELGKEMLEKCGGIPLAIVALAGLLSSKTSIHKWETIKNDVVRRIMRHIGGEDDYGVVSDILELSYFDLPFSLKPCFIYLGIFPEDSDIDVERLVQLWIAEGFIKVDQFSSSTLEEVAKVFLDELAHRCLVEIIEKDYGGDITIIRMHDLMRDLCIRKAKDWRLFEISPPSASVSTSVAQRSHHSNRIIIHHGAHSDINNPRPRSYIWLADYRRGLCEFKAPLKQMKFLRVLCLQGADLRMPGIGELVLLRYLEIDETCQVTQEILESIPKLRNLITFKCDIQNSDIPDNMVGRMDHLRHLSLPLHHIIERIGGTKLGVNNKTNLQVLRVSSGEWLTKELRDVSIGLQELRLTRISTQAQLEAIYDFVSNRCEHLHKLSLWLKFDATLEFDLHMFKARHCASLELAGKIRKQQSEPLKFPRRLLKLTLMSSQIEEEEQLKEALAELDELRLLILFGDAYMGDRLSMSGLTKLRKLTLRSLFNLKEWRVEKGGLSQLHELVIDGCRLGSLPQEIRCIRSLQHMELDDMPQVFFEGLQPPSE